MFKVEDYAGVRKHARLGLVHKIWQPRLISILAISSVPRIVSKSLLQAYRSSKAMVTGGKNT